MEKYIKIAKELGAQNVVAVTPDDIVFDDRTILKCMFGCKSWGKGCTCPSKEGFPKPWELEPLLRKYKTVLIIHAHDKKAAQKAAYEIEREAYLDGDALAFSMSDCALCAECAGKSGEACRDMKRARPAFHSVGIDVFKTVRQLGLPIDVLRGEADVQHWYSAVFVE
jgi:predicted metal-binding protein